MFSLKIGQFNRVEEVHADGSEIHGKYSCCFGDSAKTLFDLAFSSEFVRETFILEGPGVVDSHWHEDGFLYLLVEEGVSDDVLEPELGR